MPPGYLAVSRTGHFARECPEGEGRAQGGGAAPRGGGGSICYSCDRWDLATCHLGTIS